MDYLFLEQVEVIDTLVQSKTSFIIASQMATWYINFIGKFNANALIRKDFVKILKARFLSPLNGL